ncbi:2-hydroxyacid dehydrogenase [Acinetobacter sp. HY1485]|uniref:2-hydroxyacid dehydrogenase n=1 Tax=Acinetobacter sp. HY1485 TaxID=2970918 RepID=UPI0022B9C0C2|nr:2-hydroxyacid dehydrogenase [Acinetobacter sp. HY1485]
MLFKAAFLDYATLDQHDLDMHELHHVFDDLHIYERTNYSQAVDRLQDVSVAIVNKVLLDAHVLHQLPKLKLILLCATGTNNVDLDAAKKQGIVVCNCTNYGSASVAQHTFSLILALATSLVQYDKDIKAGEWQESPQFCMLNHPITELAGKTIGILGYGDIGQTVAKIAEAFGMKVLIGNLPHRPKQADRLDLNELLPQVDVLTLHCPLTSDTRNLINADALHLMKPTAFVINTARGGIVHETALAEALVTGVIAGAAVDVLTVEPPEEGNVLLDDEIPNLIVTPHTAWASVEARQRMVSQLVENAKAFKAGQPIRQV